MHDQVISIDDRHLSRFVVCSNIDIEKKCNNIDLEKNCSNIDLEKNGT